MYIAFQLLQDQASGHIKVKKGTGHVFHTNESVRYQDFRHGDNAYFLQNNYPMPLLTRDLVESDLSRMRPVSESLPSSDSSKLDVIWIWTFFFPYTSIGKINYIPFLNINFTMISQLICMNSIKKSNKKEKKCIRFYIVHHLFHTDYYHNVIFHNSSHIRCFRMWCLRNSLFYCFNHTF